jgi:hypothetical protein
MVIPILAFDAALCGVFRWLQRGLLAIRCVAAETVHSVVYYQPLTAFF